MNRKEFLKTISILPFAGTAMKLNELKKMTDPLDNTDPMPVLFIGHGSPTNAIENNEFVRGWHDMTLKLPRPQAIICISAHWQTNGTFVTAMKSPRTIHDFGGFAQELYDIKYAAPGDPVSAAEVKNSIKKTIVGLDQDWGLDHGCWVPLLRMYPDAGIPVIQLSLDYSKEAQYHYDLAGELSAFRRKGVLIIGSGNMVHNLGMVRINRYEDFNKEYGYDWAYEMNNIFKKKIMERNHKALINYPSLSKSALLAIPTFDHYFPLLYSLALQEKNEQATFFNDKAIAGSLTMTSVLIQ